MEVLAALINASPMVFASQRAKYRPKLLFLIREGFCSVCFPALGRQANIRRRDIVNTHDVRDLMADGAPSSRRI
jgi:hypothetical protein